MLLAPTGWKFNTPKSKFRCARTELKFGVFCFMEIWKDIPGFDSRYQISNLGNVKVKQYIRSNGKGVFLTKEKLLKPFIEHGGYQKIVLYSNGKNKRMKVHRLVAMAFIPNPYNKPEIDHVNTNTLDNRVENLRWVTSKENHFNVLTRRHMSIAKKNNNCKSVICIDSSGNTTTFGSIKHASIMLGVSGAHISQCCKCKRKSAGGYKWEYAI